MNISRVFSAIALPCIVGVVACVIEPGPPAAVTPVGTTTPATPTTPATTPTAVPTTVPTQAPTDAGGVDATIADAATPTPAASDAAAPPSATDGGGADKFHACNVDSDCVAVDRVGCCKNGVKEAVASSQATAYAQSFKCPEAHPICAMHIAIDPRLPECDNGTHQCTMVAPADIHCGGFILNKHACPSGYTCQMKNPDVAGSCVAAGAGTGH